MIDDSRVSVARAQLEQDGQVESHLVEGVLSAYDERLRVNVGLVAENAELRKQAREHRCGGAA